MSLVVLQELGKALRDSEQTMTPQMATAEDNSEIRMSGRKLANSQSLEDDVGEVAVLEAKKGTTEQIQDVVQRYNKTV